MADDGIAVSVPITDDEEYEDEALRAQASVNSPKGPKQGFSDDTGDEVPGNGMSLNLEVDEDEDYESANVTPNTKIRDDMDINSPRRHGHQQQWDEDDPNAGGGVAGLVTQVARDDPTKQSGVGQKQGGGVESLVTQVPRDDDTEITIRRQTAQTGGMCACLSCLWSCCSGPQPPGGASQDVSLQPTGGAPAYNADGAAATTKQENAKDSLLANSTGAADSKRGDAEDSMESSTEYPEGLLPPLLPQHVGKKCLVLDLDETLVHSSFKPIPKPDFIIPVEIDRVVHHVYVLKRPFVDEFMLRASKCYEIVIFTASLSKYADPLLDKLDIHNVITHRLFRESCVIHGSAYVKDMRRLNRKLKDTIIVDNSPPSYLFQPANAVPIASWFDDPTDTQLLDFCPVIETTMKDIRDVRLLLDANNKSFRWLCNQADQPLSKYTIRNDKSRQ